MSENFGPYEIRGKLGAGAMAVVWRAWDPKLERDVAIKEPIRTPAMSEAMASELAERFVREGKTSARLSHPGIVTIFAADVFDGRSAIVMELLRGHTLSALIDQNRMPPSATFSILDQLLDALDYAHTMGVVHRDVKPDNVFVTDDGRVKLTDFGVAHVSRIDEEHDAIIAGSPGYMSPEQIRAEPVDGRADVFSMGAIAYEMLTGANPFGATDGSDTHTIMYRTTSGPEPVFDPAVGVPTGVQSVILRALARDAADRYQSAAQLRYDLRVAASDALMGGPGSLADVVEDAGPYSMPGVSFTSATVDSAKRHLPEKGSTGWAWGTAAIGTVFGLGLLAILSGSGGFGLMVMAAAGVGAVVMTFSKRDRSSNALTPDVVAMSEGLTPTKLGIDIQLTGPNENRIERVTLPATIGRSGDVSIAVADEVASRRHALFEERAGAVWVVDLGSRNGTYVDGALVTRAAQLGPYSVVTIGSTDIRVVRE